MAKNHEQYLELVEHAVAETTEQLLADCVSVDQLNIRDLHRRIAEKEVDIQRIKGHLVGVKTEVKKLRAENGQYVKEIETYGHPNLLHAHVEKFKKLYEEEQKKTTRRTRSSGRRMADADDYQKELIYTESGALCCVKVEQLKEKNAKLMDCSYDEYCGLIAEHTTENKLVKEFEDLKNECGFLGEKLDEGTEQHLAEIKKLNEFYEKTKKENEELKRKFEEGEFEAADTWITAFQEKAKELREVEEVKVKWLEAEVQAFKNARKLRSDTQIEELNKRIVELVRARDAADEYGAVCEEAGKDFKEKCEELKKHNADLKAYGEAAADVLSCEGYWWCDERKVWRFEDDGLDDLPTKA